ncbi:MAG: exodeoxyribonuclease III [Patescibacteria group bacterium]
MKLISWNVNGLRAVHKRGQFLEFIKKEKPDILCLQEVKAREEQLPEEIKNISGYHAYFNSPHEKKGYSGVAIYTKEKPKKVEYGMAKALQKSARPITGFAGDLGDVKKFDTEGRLLAAHYDDFVLLNVYFPNGGGGPARLKYKRDFYDAFLEHIELLRNPKPSKDGRARQKSIIFCGDINTAHESVDLARPKENEESTGFLPEERAWIDEVVYHGYTDVFRHFNPNKKDAYTYWDMKTRARHRNVGWRIDYFFVSQNLLPKVRGTKILSDVYGSDHCPIVMELETW